MTVAAPIATILVLTIIAIIDWQRHEIWHAVTIPSIVAAVLVARWLPARFTANALLGALVTFTLFLLIQLLATHHYGAGALGFGDVMLAALIGALGGLGNGLLWLAIGMVFAGVFAAWLRFVRKTVDGRLAYGSWLAIGGIVGILAAF